MAGLQTSRLRHGDASWHSGTGSPVKHDRLFWYLVKVNNPVYTTVHLLTGQVTYYKEPETHDHVYLVTMWTNVFDCYIARFNF